MEKLKEKFNRYGLNYKLIKRNEFAALFGISGTYTDRITHYEVVKIHYRDDQYGQRESISDNAEFGRDGSRALNHLKQAERYFQEFSEQLKSAQLIKTAHRKAGKTPSVGIST